MVVRNITLTQEEREMVLEVMQSVRKQNYTAEILCERQKILDTQYFYWWMNDMKVEEKAADIFTENFEAYCTGFGKYPGSAYGWARSAKYGNSFMNTAHMGHQPLVWIKDQNHARGIFFFESAMNYMDNPSDELKQFYIYCNDFEKQADGNWKISAYRLIETKQIGEMRADTVVAPDDYSLPGWDGKSE